MKEIISTEGRAISVDDEDFDLCSQYKWVVRNRGRRWVEYAESTVRIDGRHLLIHRLVMNAPRGVDVDHRNGNGLDNQRHNLRFANDSQNQANRSNLSLNTSGYRGVTFSKSSKKWQAGIKVAGKSQHLGLFTSKEEAARAYDARAVEVFGEFARPNFPTGGAA